MSKFMLLRNPYNWGNDRTNRSEVADRNLNTFYQGSSITAIISENGLLTGVARRASHIFTVTETSTSYNVSLQNVSLPASVTVDGRTISKQFEGKTYTFHELTTPLTAVSLPFAFIPSGKIYRLAVLDDTGAFNRENDFLFDILDVDRVHLGRVHTAADGSVSDSPPLNNMSPKWRVRLRAQFYGTQNPDTLTEQLLAFFGANREFFVCVDTTELPYLCFSAILENRDIQIRLLSNKLGAGRARSVAFTIRER